MVKMKSSNETEAVTSGSQEQKIRLLTHGSNERDSSYSTERSSPVMLSAAKHLAADRDRPFAEFTLSEANGLRVTRCDCSNGRGLFFTIEPCLTGESGEGRQTRA